MVSSLIIHTYPLGQMQANCYILLDTRTHECLIVDPADEGNFIADKVHQLRGKPKAVLITHGHFDHVMAAFEITYAFHIPFFAHKSDKFLLDRLVQSAKHYLKADVLKAPPVDTYLTDGDVIRFGESSVSILHTPGHTPGSVCLYDKKNLILFSGDLIFEGGAIGRSDFSYSSRSDMKKSLQKILALPDTLQIYPGHGNSTILAREKERLESFLTQL